MAVDALSRAKRSFRDRVGAGAGSPVKAASAGGFADDFSANSRACSCERRSDAAGSDVDFAVAASFSIGAGVVSGCDRGSSLAELKSRFLASPDI